MTISNSLTAKERLDIIENMAYRTMPVHLIAAALNEDEDVLALKIREHKTPEHDAYYQGFIRQTIEIKEATIKAAKNGSNPAQAEILKSLAEIQSVLNG